MAQLSPVQVNPDIRALYANACQQCGMCCVFYAYHPFCMPISTEGVQPPRKLIQIGPNVQTKHPKLPYTSKYLRVIDDPVWEGHRRCAALKGRQGEDVACSIYDERPAVCSDFDPGSPECLRIRTWGRLEPLDDRYGCF
jgi:Fe-S-cluster containining protein